MANYPYQTYAPTQPVYGAYIPQPYPAYPPQPGTPQNAIPQPVQQPIQPMQPAMQAQPITANNAGFVCIPVTSREEAVATRVEAFGPPALMPDMGHGMIYYKRFNEKTALADFEEYQRVQPSDEQEPPAVPTFDISALVGAIQSRFDTVEHKVDALAERLDRPTPKATSTSRGGSKK